ncbi:type II toxin-antitoxin system VapC family toxin [Thiohalocapsa sp. ML1]|jgi:ribonuclease VapC|uniref:type II toxin-antitoxin system VapC family toxin n=1 Tax=Thiohalocapsa sp. ML1 TaxID=1431688 RepID=UPI000731F1AE|nr:type II toxin-antitoxin system VapC family toxin [Thiohalocapsa sp. ML1]
MAASIDLAVDTSALTAILLGEPEAPDLLRALTGASRPGLCAPNRTELLLVIQARLGDLGLARARELLRRQQIETVVLDEALADAAADAYRRFGKGRHPAGLNFGDCFAYALAAREQVPLLFKGNDFSLTDVGVPRALPDRDDL